MFSYVGRLKDSRKGLELFLDALEILWESLPANAFAAWVIGGGDGDTEWAIRSAQARPTLRSEISHGNLIFWGRVENEALPEFYSRSTALVVPSFREQFCIAAVEAMMCGCPVIASKVGGLNDVIVNDRTGNLFERGSVLDLVAIMATYIKCPSVPRWLGKNAASWAKTVFDADTIWPCLESLLESPLSFSSSRWRSPSDAFFRQILIENSLPVVERLLGSRVTAFEDRSSSPALSFLADLEDRSVFVKVYGDRPTSLSYLHGSQFSGQPGEICRERMLMTLHLQGQDFFPAVLAYDLDAAIVIQECASEVHLSSADHTRALAREVLSAIRNFDPLPETIALRGSLRTALLSNPTLDEQVIKKIDDLSVAIHSPLVGGTSRTRRMHPQIELLRIHRFLRSNSFCFPREYCTRALSTIQFVLAAKPLLPVYPLFAHGTLKVEHFLQVRGKTVLCDFDHSGYYCGPVDEAHWIWDYCIRSLGYHPTAMLKYLRDELSSEDELFLGICWILAFQFNRDLMARARGDSKHLKITIGFLYEFLEATRSVFPTL